MGLTQCNGPVLPSWRLGWPDVGVSAQLSLPPISAPALLRQQSFVCLTPHSLRRRLGPFRLTHTAHPTTDDRRRPTNCHAAARLNPTTPESAAKSHTDCTSTSPAAQTRPAAAASKHPPPAAPVFPAHTITVTSLRLKPIGTPRSTCTNTRPPMYA
jgi:hypothetical protein